MNNMILRHFKSTLFPLLAAGLLGCVKEDLPSASCGAVPDGSVTITVNIPGQQTPSVPSRSIAGADGEAAVKTIDVFVFKRIGAREVLTDYASGKIAGQSSEIADDYRVRFTAQLKSDPAAATVAVIANVPAATIAAAAALSDKEDILEMLVHASTNPSGTPEGWKWNAKNPSDYTPIPMYGEYDVTRGGTYTEGIKNGMKMDGVELVRMLARVDVTNSAQGFTLSGVYVANYNTAGYIAPAWGAGGILNTVLPADPTPPAEADQPDAMYYPGSGFTGDIYIYEAEANKGAEYHADAICLIVRGRYTGDSQDTYYRIDFTNGTDAAGKTLGTDGFDPSTIGYMPVYRNHCYSFNIQEVAGPGYAGFDEALSAPGIMNNLKCSLLVVNARGIKNIVFNGEHYLGVGDPVVLDTAGSDVGVLVSTNYSAGWSIEKIIYPGTEKDWLTAVKENSGNVRTANLQLSATANNKSQQRTALVVLSAGRLKYELEVTQDLRQTRSSGFPGAGS